MTILYVLAGLAIAVGPTVVLFLSSRARRRSQTLAAPSRLTDEQLQQVERLLWSEKLIQKVSKRGLRGRPIL